MNPLIIDNATKARDPRSRVLVFYRNDDNEPWGGGTGECRLGNIREAFEANQRRGSWKYRQYRIEAVPSRMKESQKERLREIKAERKELGIKPQGRR